MKSWEDFLDLWYKDRLTDIADGWEEDYVERSLFIDLNLLTSYPDLHNEVLDRPDDAIKQIRAAVRKLEPDINPVTMMSVGFSNHPERITVRDIRYKHVGKLISIDGAFSVVGKGHPRANRAAFECLSCGQIMKIKQISPMEFIKPSVCRNENCSRKQFKYREDLSEVGDMQYIKFQESSDGISIGTEPKDILCTLQDDLVTKLKIVPGQSGNIVGIVRARLEKIGRNVTADYELWIEVLYASVDGENYEDVKFSDEEEKAIREFSKQDDIFEKLSDSLSPQTLGNKAAKDNLTLQMFSSPQKIMPDGTPIRGSIHVFVVGDPGVAKSQLLNAVKSIMGPRCVFTSGESSTAAGLLAAVDQDEFQGKQRVLKAGAMVIADGGMCIIDEFDKMDGKVQGALHTAMGSGQSIHVSKWGLSKTFPTRCSVLAAANPRHGRFDRSMPIISQIDLTPAMFSRFDMIITIFDVPNRDRDRAVGNLIGDSIRAAEHYRRNERDVDVVKKMTPPVDHAFMRRYVLYAAKYIHPLLTPEIQEVLVNYYVTIRDYDRNPDDPVPASARSAASLYRFAEASARTRLSDTIELEDAHRAIRMVENLIDSVCRDPVTGKVDVDITELGASRAMIDQTNVVFGIIRELGGDERPINLVSLIKEAERIGIDTKTLGSSIRLLIRYSEIEEWGEGVYKIR